MNNKINKYEYLTKHLSKTYRKSHENYVINRIYNLVNNDNLVPEGQRYVRKKDGKYYLIDLYFPQINIGIECDEPHHKKQKGKDIKRELSIIDVLSRVISEYSYCPIHIDITYDYDDIEKQINKAVKIINQRIAKVEKDYKHKLNFEEYLKGEEFDRNRTNVIAIHNDYRFNTITEVDNKVFNRKSKNQQHAGYAVNEKYKAWFPKLVLDNGKAPTKWNNVLSNDGKTIYEYNENDFDKSINKTYKEDRYRVTFARIQDPVTRQKYYRFVGVFERQAIKKGKRVYKRIDDKFLVIK